MRQRAGTMRAGVICLVAGVLGACVPVHDFGRAPPSFTETRIVPNLGRAMALQREEVVSLLPLTAPEKRLRSQAYTIVVSRDILGRAGATKPYLRYHRVLVAWPHTTPVESYHQHLMRTRFADTDTRYRRIESDMRKDLSSIGPFEAVARQVIARDRARQQNLNTTSVSERSAQASLARIEENRRVTYLTLDTLSWRVRQYAHAIDHLLVETPSERDGGAHLVYRDLQRRVEILNSEILPLLGTDVKDLRGGPVDFGASYKSAGAGTGAQPYSLARPR